MTTTYDEAVDILMSYDELPPELVPAAYLLVMAWEYGAWGFIYSIIRRIVDYYENVTVVEATPNYEAPPVDIVQRFHNDALKIAAMLEINQGRVMLYWKTTRQFYSNPMHIAKVLVMQGHDWVTPVKVDRAFQLVRIAS